VKSFNFTVNVEQNLIRADVFVAESVPELTRNAAQHLFDNGHIRSDGKPIKKNMKLKAGTALEIEMPDAEPIEAQAENIALDIIYEDDDLLVINKPRGMVVHPAAGNPSGTLVNALLAHCGDSLSGINGKIRPGIVHRLDKDTSGLMLAAKNDRSHVSLAAQIGKHTAARVYEAIVVGNLRENSGVIDAPIGRSKLDRKKMAVTEQNSKTARTHYEVIARYCGYTYVRCKLETGRTHQIRVHMAHIGHPVAGDTVYGGKNDPLRLGGQCLHSREIEFTHPSTGERLHFTTDLPEYFAKLLKRFEDISNG